MKAYPESIGLLEIWEYFKEFPLAHLATLDGDQPRVRSMSLIAHNDRLWLATKTEWDKVDQIRKNSNVEFTVSPLTKDGTGSIRLTAVAVLVKDRATRHTLASAIPWFDQYWNHADDPNFTLIRLDITRILYDHPTDRKKYTVSLT